MNNPTWDLSVFYKGFDDPAFLEDVQAIDMDIKAVEALLKSEKDDRQKLEEVLACLEISNMRTTRLFGFISLTLSVEAMNEPAASFMDQVMNAVVPLREVGSEINRYVASIPNLDEVIASSEELTRNAFIIKEMKEAAAHMLPKELEKWMLRMSLTGGDAFSQLRDKLDSTLLVDYDGKQIPLSAARAKAYDPDANVRKAAYEAEIASYKKVEIPMAACLNAIKGQSRTMAEARSFPSVLAWTLDSSRMDEETLTALWTAVKEYLPDFRRYLRAKGKYLGHNDGLPFYDLFAPVGKSTRTYTIDEAHDLLVREMSKFSPKMGAFIDNAFAQRWIDVYPKEGKSGGAFCMGCYEKKLSRVLTNFAGSFSDISTIAHELGHAWHNKQLENKPLLLTDTPMPLAETASIFNETLLSHIVMQSTQGEEKFTLLEAELMEATQTVVDIYSRFLFESAVIDARATHSMSVEELKKTMLDAQEASYGNGLSKDCRHPYMWACKSHYYSPDLSFYNFPYAFGLLFGKGVFAQYLEKGKAFVPVYNALLASCGSDTVVNVAASVGIDVHSADFWRSSLAVLKDDIDEFCRLCEEK